MIRVLHYGMSPNLGGIETYLFNLSRTIDSSRFQFDFLYSDHGQEPVYAADLPTSRFYGVTPRRISPQRNRRELDELFARTRFDILHFHANTASYVEPVRAALRHGVRVVFHSHNAGASRSRLTRALHRWNQRTLPWSRIASVAVSGEAGRWMFGHRPFTVIYNGIDVASFAFSADDRNRARAALELAPDALVVGHVGAFLPAKNHTFLVSVFAEIVRRRPDARLLLIGAGPLETQVKRQVDSLGISANVLFLGRRTDVPAVMSGMDVFAFPSLHEGWGIVALEAQASGLPCVLSCNVPSDVVVSPSCRRLSLDRTPEAWVEALMTAGAGDRTVGATTVRAAGYTLAANTDAVSSLYDGLTSR